jgi:hypothetical protein
VELGDEAIEGIDRAAVGLAEAHARTPAVPCRVAAPPAHRTAAVPLETLLSVDHDLFPVHVFRIACRRAASRPVGAENLCHQAIFVDYATSAVMPPDPEMIQVGDAVWQRP